jgi:hypothetical protein
MGATEALQHAREQGVKIRTQTWYRLWGETRAAADRVGALSASNMHRRPTAEEITPMTVPKAKGYLYTVNVAVRDRLTGEVFYTPSGYRSDTLVSKNRALQGAIEAAQAAQEANRESFGGQILGGTLTQVRQFIPEDETGEVL